MEMPGLPKTKEMGNRTFAEAMRDPKIPLEKKLHTIGTICEMQFINGLTRADLHAMLKVSYAVPDQAVCETNEYICGNCGCAIDDRDNYCRMCGKKIGKRGEQE